MKLPTKGKYFWKKEWYSICSIHHQHNEKCEMCNTGNWHNVLLGNILNFLYYKINIFYKIWQLWQKFFGKLKFQSYKDIKIERRKKLKKIKKNIFWNIK